MILVIDPAVPRHRPDGKNVFIYLGEKDPLNQIHRSMIEGWNKVFTSPQEFEAVIIKDLLEENGLHPVLLSQKDSEFLLGEVGVFVAPEEAEKAFLVIEANQAGV